MSVRTKRPTPLQAEAMLIALMVRNQMEEFHVKHLSDAQMRELNPIVRNAIYEALVLFGKAARGQKAAQRALKLLSVCVPVYWELPTERGVTTR